MGIPKTVKLKTGRPSGTACGSARVGANTCETPSTCRTLVAARFNPELKCKYQAMVAAGKPPKVALTTLMRKLIELANTLIKNDRKWIHKAA